jgi:DNA-binding MarR family transcriptional regulator
MALRERNLGGAAADEAREVMDAIRRIVRALRVASRGAERRVGVSAAQLFVLHTLAEDGPLSINALAARTLTHQSSVSVVVQRLVDRGLVGRARSASDRRRLELSLTPHGRRILARSPGPAQDKLIGSIEAMAPRDRRQLAALLTQLVRAAGLDGQTPGMFFEE